MPRPLIKMFLTPAVVGSRVEINGVDVTHLLRGVSVVAGVGGTTKVTLDLVASQVQIEGEGLDIVRALPLDEAPK